MAFSMMIIFVIGYVCIRKGLLLTFFHFAFSPTFGMNYGLHYLPSDIGLYFFIFLVFFEMQPDEYIARVAVFLASDDSAWITGERLTASGGYS